MSEDEAALSFLTGLFAGKADTYLGSDHFISKTRAEAWDLTWEKLAAWQVEAIEMGVPKEILKPDEIVLQMMPNIIEIGIKLQQLVDLRSSESTA